MKRLIICVLLVVSFAPLAKAQYWDWVTDEKKMAAFQEQYLSLRGQIGKMGEYLAYTEAIKKQQQDIAEKVRFIHMVRDSLFKSLQDVRGIENSLDERIIRDVFGQVEAYYGHIYYLSNKHEDFKDTWNIYNNYVVSHSKTLLKITDMAVKGSDEKNLLDKEQRMLLLSYALYEIKGLREMSKRTYNQLVVGNAGKENTYDVVIQKINEIYNK
jgi:hypothetical protein